jgi:hypothetical protein
VERTGFELSAPLLVCQTTAKLFRLASVSLMVNNSLTHDTDILIVSRHGELRMSQTIRNGVADESIYGEWSRATNNERREAGDI